MSCRRRCQTWWSRWPSSSRSFSTFAGGSDDLVIVDGQVASVEIARLLFVAHKIPEDERDRVRRDLLEYCKRDTWATVKLVERLRELAVG